MGTIVKCAQCGSTDFDLHDYDTMMVLCSELALFGLHCAECGANIAAVCVIPPDMHELVRRRAAEVGAGMGRQASAGTH